MNTKSYLEDQDLQNQLIWDVVYNRNNKYEFDLKIPFARNRIDPIPIQINSIKQQIYILKIGNNINNIFVIDPRKSEFKTKKGSNVSLMALSPGEIYNILDEKKVKTVSLGLNLSVSNILGLGVESDGERIYSKNELLNIKDFPIIILYIHQVIKNDSLLIENYNFISIKKKISDKIIDMIDDKRLAIFEENLF